MSSTYDFSSRPRRSNGLSRPYSKAQISTWVTWPAICLQFLFFLSPILPVAASVPCTIVFFVFAIAAAYYAVKTMSVDPIDNRLAHHLSQQEGAEPLGCPSPQSASGEETKQCWICDLQVADHSMHCKFCNKCVGHFDHHCMWLNNCIGKANYPYFFKTMQMIFGMVFVHFGVQVGLVVDILLKGESEERAEDWFNANASEAMTAVMFFFIVFDMISLSLMGQLLAFHYSLRRKGLTTYQYIVKENQRKRDLNKIMVAREGRRVLATAQAREEGKMCLVWRLRMGGVLGKTCGSCCDPLPEDQPTGPASPEAHTTNGAKEVFNGVDHDEENGGQDAVPSKDEDPNDLENSSEEKNEEQSPWDEEVKPSAE